jgi:hypothetical protein
MKAGAEAVTTQLGAWMATNAASTIPVEWMHNVGLSYKTALVALVVQFTVRVVYAAALYVQTKPDPDYVERDSSAPDPDAAAFKAKDPNWQPPASKP